MATIGFLHTSDVHTPVFEALVAEIAPGGDVVTRVDAPLLDRARVVGAGASEVRHDVEAHLAALRDDGVDLAVCTCSTIGGVAEQLSASVGLRVVRVDRPMADRAVDVGGRVAVLAAVDSTLGPTADLLRSVAEQRGSSAEISVQLIEGAWERFESNDLAGYYETIARAAEQAATKADVVVLAQASMAPAADLVVCDVPVLCSPRVAVESLLGASNQSPGTGQVGDLGER